MTLVAVWKPVSGKLMVVSDSRVTFGELPGGTPLAADFAPKLFSIPLRVKGSDADDGTARFYVDQRIGIAVTGSFFSAQATVGILPELLSRLLGIPGSADLALSGIVAAIASVYSRVAKQVGEVLFDNALGQILVLGFCPVAQDDQVWRIELSAKESGVHPTISQVSVAPDAVFFGSGAKPARDLVKKQPGIQPFRAVKVLCDDPIVPSVGGNLQFGAIPGRDFEIFAIQEHRTDEDNRAVSTGIFLAGVELLRQDDAWIANGLYPAASILRPFLPDVGLLQQRGYDVKPFD